MSGNFMVVDDEAEMIDQRAIGELARAIELVTGGREMDDAGMVAFENEKAELEPELVFRFRPAIIPITLDDNGAVVDDLIFLE